MPNELTRREFIGGTVALAASLSLPSTGFQRKVPILGLGAHTYECHHDWLVAPNGLNFGDTHGIATDRARNIYIAHTVGSGSTKSDAVCVYDAKGKFIRSWGSEFAGGAHGLDLRKEGSQEYLYHCDTRRRLVVKTDLKGTVIWTQGWPKNTGFYSSEDQWCPTNVAFAPDGDLFVGDGYGSSYIFRLTKDGEFVGVISPPGSGKGQVRCPHGLWVDSRAGKPELLVADRSNRRIQRMTLAGEHLGFITDGVRMPCHIHFKDGEMLVPDLESVVSIFDKENKPIVHLGDGHPSNLRGASRDQYIEGKFIHPHAAAWINSRDIVVVEWVPTGRITLLKKVD